MKVKLFGTQVEFKADGRITGGAFAKVLIDQANENAEASPDQGDAQVARLINYYGQANVEVIELDPDEPGEEEIRY